MGTAARVLLIGDNMGHLAVKANVLQHFWGVRLLLTGAAAEDEALRSLDETEVAVVCSTLPEPERQAWIDRIRQHAPHLLVVKMNGYDAGPHANADATVDEAHGPGALVSTLYQLLNEKGLPSRAWPEPGEQQVWVQ